jgi:hypothetical protein
VVCFKSGPLFPVSLLRSALALPKERVPDPGAGSELVGALPVTNEACSLTHFLFIPSELARTKHILPASAHVLGEPIFMRGEFPQTLSEVFDTLGRLIFVLSALFFVSGTLVLTLSAPFFALGAFLQTLEHVFHVLGRQFRVVGRQFHVLGLQRHTLGLQWHALRSQCHVLGSQLPALG